jgi:nucleotide-binding universal stress UspA family protein
LATSSSFPFSKILVPVDQSENSSRALEYALKLAKSTASKVVLLSVIQDIPSYSGESYVSIQELEKSFQESTKKYVDDLLKKAEMKYDIKAQGIVRQGGHPARIILDVAKSEGADLIIMGSRGMGSFKKMLLGSVSHAVISHATVPVLTVR